jgi:16S rRNA U516 pseudouridylate synthase RsuA-like enzyme
MGAVLRAALGSVAGEVSLVGKLGHGTTGLLLITNDSSLCAALCLPGICTSEYIATVRTPMAEPPSSEILCSLTRGVQLGGGEARAVAAEVCMACILLACPKYARETMAGVSWSHATQAHRSP